ncbi:MAG: putative toxin-antitoxin system toxin component, PIN family [Saprospiraceae bacterium]
MRRVVLDTNVLLFAISRRTDYYAIWIAFQNGAFDLCVTTDILDEYAEKLYEKFRPEVGDNTMKAIENSLDVVRIHKYYFWNLITVDPDDNKFVDCAVAANADFICTEDKHFKVLKQIPFPSVAVISADDFVEMLTGSRPVKKK